MIPVAVGLGIGEVQIGHGVILSYRTAASSRIERAGNP
jgi:hypothetical protein